MSSINVYDARKLGQTYCQTEGSEHYKHGSLEPLDLIIAKNLIEDFCLGNIIKYATRFKVTQNINDLKKIIDYAHILCGVKLNACKHEWRVDYDNFVEGCIGAICIKCGMKGCGCDVLKQHNDKIPESFWQKKDVTNYNKKLK